MAPFSRSPDRCRVLLRRFAARLPGLASGLALAVRPAGSAEAPRSTARAAGASARRSTVDVGGGRRGRCASSGPVPVTFRPALGALAVGAVGMA